jgi:hypothetical protein
MRRVLASLVLVCGTAMLATACGQPAATPASSTPAATQQPGSPTAAATAAATTQPPATAPSPSGPATAAIETFTDSEGNKVQMTLTIGQPEALSSVSDQVANACNDGIPVGQGVVFPLDMTLTLESSVAVSVLAGLGPAFVTSEAITNPDNPMGSPPGPGFWWAASIADGPTCISDNTPAVIQFSLVAGGSASADGYVIAPEAITPDNPTGLANSAGGLVMQPAIDINTGEASPTITIDTADSPNLVQCGGTANGMFDDNYVALDPKYVIGNGCTK